MCARAVSNSNCKASRKKRMGVECLFVDSEYGRPRVYQ
jgi:hypothetical protein